MFQITERDVNAFRNKLFVSDVIQSAMRIVLYWVCRKRMNETFYDYIERISADDENIWRYLRKQLKNFQELLRQTNSEHFDITLLYQLIPLTCDFIDMPGSKHFVDKIRDPNSMEYLLKQLKDVRNKVFHDVSQQAADIHSEILPLVIKLLKTTGVKAAREQQEIDSAVEEMEIRANEVIEKTTPPEVMSHREIKFNFFIIVYVLHVYILCTCVFIQYLN